MSLAIIGDASTVMGFGLAGVTQLFEVEADAELIKAKLLQVNADILIIPNSYASLVEKELSRVKFAIVRLPEGDDEDLVAKLMREAIGFSEVME